MESIPNGITFFWHYPATLSSDNGQNSELELLFLLVIVLGWQHHLVPHYDHKTDLYTVLEVKQRINTSLIAEVSIGEVMFGT